MEEAPLLSYPEIRQGLVFFNTSFLRKNSGLFLGTQYALGSVSAYFEQYIESEGRQMKHC